MPTELERPKVDVGAIAGALQDEAVKRVASAIVLSFDNLDEAENPLNELQKAEIIENALHTFDGFERAAARVVVDALTRNEVATWGFSTELADLLPSDVS
jgi:hypothetical protein